MNKKNLNTSDSLNIGCFVVYSFKLIVLVMCKLY